jgi:hypothetical protein
VLYVHLTFIALHCDPKYYTLYQSMKWKNSAEQMLKQTINQFYINKTNISSKVGKSFPLQGIHDVPKVHEVSLILRSYRHVPVCQRHTSGD